MNDQIRALVGLIRREEVMLQEFLELLERQKGFLLDNESEAFETSVTRQTELLQSIRGVEQERVTVIAQIARTLKIEGEELTLTRLIETTLGEFDEELRELKRSLNRLVDRIRKANQVNAHLVHRSLDYLHKSVAWLIDSGDLSVTYTAGGEVNQRAVGAVLLNKQM